MNARLISTILLAFALSACASRELPPLKVQPEQPEHPRIAAPPKELMQMDCRFLPMSICKPRK